MNPPLNQYLEKWLNHGDLDAYHSLIESKQDCVAMLRMSYGQYKSALHRRRIIELAKEIPGEETFDLLLEAVYSPAPGVWQSAIEALVYHGSKDLRGKLLSLKSISALAEEQDKQAYLTEVLCSLESP